MSSLPVSRIPLHVPPLSEVAKVLGEGLSKNFQDVSVDVVDCPDLRLPPFSLATEGLCGDPRLADIGGPPFLLPLPQRNKKYCFESIGESVELPGSLMIGAGAGPCHIIGVNSEMMANAKLASGEEEIINKTRISKVSLEDGSCILGKSSSSEFCLMANLLCSRGLPGKVIHVRAAQRTGKENFMSSMRKTLNTNYGTKPVGLGGAFVIKSGKAKFHIMPDFSEVPLDTQEKVDSWLKFYEMSAPLVCMGELVSHDPGFDLRVEHFHGYNENGEGGHYHYDTTPNEIAYQGYFTVAECLYRVDQPPNSMSM